MKEYYHWFESQSNKAQKRILSGESDPKEIIYFSINKKSQENSTKITPMMATVEKIYHNSNSNFEGFGMSHWGQSYISGILAGREMQFIELFQMPHSQGDYAIYKLHNDLEHDNKWKGKNIHIRNKKIHSMNKVEIISMENNFAEWVSGIPGDLSLVKGYCPKPLEEFWEKLEKAGHNNCLKRNKII